MNIYVNGVKQGGGGAVLPDTPAAVLLDVANAGDIVGLAPVTGVGSTVGMDVIVDNGSVELITAPPSLSLEGTALVFDGAAPPAGAMRLTSPDVSALLKAAYLPFTSVIDAKEHITNNGNPHDLLSVNCGTANRGYILRFTVGASNATTWQAGVSWDIIAAVTHDGAVTIRNSVITKSDPASPWNVSLTVPGMGNSVKLVVTGQVGTNVAWFAGGFLTIYDGVNPP